MTEQSSGSGDRPPRRKRVSATRTNAAKKSPAKAAAQKAAAQKAASQQAASAPPSPPQPAPQPAQTPQTPQTPQSPQTVSEAIRAQTLDSWQTLSRNLAEAMTRTNNSFATAFHDQSQTPMPARADPFDVQGTLNTVWAHVGARPDSLRAAHADLWRRYGEIWQDHVLRMVQGVVSDELPAQSVRDKRFRDEEWRANPAFSLMRDTYLATAEFITGLVENAEGLDDASKRKAAFFIKQAVDAASPSNFALTNPAVLRQTLATQGENLLKGAANLSEDLRRGHGMLAIRQTDLQAFEVGKNIATAPGKVVFRNRLIELLQFTPTTETVKSTPLLIFPPWINKYYILDLQPKNSMIRWLVAQGHTVFVASWVNPNAELSALGFEDYMREGVLAALEATLAASDAESANTVGYCIGGTLLASTLAYMAQVGDDRIASATFFAAQTDFVKSGDLLVFADQPGIRYIAERIDKKGGFLDAQAMADTFNALRANDLVWNYVVDNYYLGKDPAPFDLLYWNSDQTRMPKALHLFYLQKMYYENALANGELTLLGKKIDLGAVDIPIYMQAAKEDHIAPSESVYRGARLFGGDAVTFTLAGSGHIAGVINHPDSKKYQHWVNSALPETFEDWLAGATEHPGSWWPHWEAWLAEHSEEEVPARKPGAGPLPVLGDAPGTYVLVKSVD